MTGTGTENDPFLVDNWADFMTIDTSIKGIYVKWADSENKIIDFNDIQPEGFSETVFFPENVDFNGWTLKNFHSTANYAIRYSASANLIKNLIFENFYTASQYTFYGIWLLKNCIISGIVAGTNSTIFAGCGLQNCSANITANLPNRFSFVSGGGFSSPKTQITNSDIILEISCPSVTICDSTIKNSRISGKIQADTSSITLGGSSSMSNVFNLESNCPLKYTSSAISIFNSDMSEKSSDSNKNFTGVNSEQLRNAEYLYNIGFPIGVD